MAGSEGEVAVPKFRMDRRFLWEHHRHGWGFVTDLIHKSYCCAGGTLFVNAVEDQFYYEGPLREAWVGILHQVPQTDLPLFPDLARLLEMPQWIESKPWCLGLWTLCDYTRQFLLQADIGVPVETLPYPAPDGMAQFDWDRFKRRARPRLLHVGEFLRNYQAFFDLDVPGWDKEFLVPEDWPQRKLVQRLNDSVTIRDSVDNATYDMLMTESVVFVELHDAPANTLVVECLATATPICVNPVGGVVDYLGQDYPLYAEGEVARLLGDDGRLKATQAYLRERRGRTVDVRKFHEALRSSAIYAALPVPAG
jgi:hypothetical protein